MNEYKIIEDCSPFFIRYTFKELPKLIKLCKTYIPNKISLKFNHHKLDNNQTEKILNLLPVNKQMPLLKKRISLFITEPGFYYNPHKDGLDHRFSLNFPIVILDDKCVTNWYSDVDLNEYKISTEFVPSLNIKISNTSREILDWNKSKHIPIKSMVAKPYEAILFNTEIFHDWDNSASPNRRVILTLRHATPGLVYFEDARKIMFGF